MDHKLMILCNLGLILLVFAVAFANAGGGSGSGSSSNARSNSFGKNKSFGRNRSFQKSESFGRSSSFKDSPYYVSGLDDMESESDRLLDDESMGTIEEGELLGFSPAEEELARAGSSGTPKHDEEAPRHLSYGLTPYFGNEASVGDPFTVCQGQQATIRDETKCQTCCAFYRFKTYDWHEDTLSCVCFSAQV